jgi:ABC-type antimicrobial peptide transport system permease subunit
MMRWATTWATALVAGFHFLVVTILVVLSMMKGTIRLHSDEGEVLYAVITITILGVITGLMGVYLASKTDTSKSRKLLWQINSVTTLE